MKKPIKPIEHKYDVYPIESGFVTFKQAKILKTLGYNQPAYGYYSVLDKSVNRGTTVRECQLTIAPQSKGRSCYMDGDFHELETIAAPSLAQVSEFLRKKHIYVDVCPYYQDDSLVFDLQIHSFALCPEEPYNTHSAYPFSYATYNEALSAGITEAMKIYLVK